MSIAHSTLQPVYRHHNDHNPKSFSPTFITAKWWWSFSGVILCCYYAADSGWYISSQRAERTECVCEWIKDFPSRFGLDFNFMITFQRESSRNPEIFCCWLPLGLRQRVQGQNRHTRNWSEHFSVGMGIFSSHYVTSKALHAVEWGEMRWENLSRKGLETTRFSRWSLRFHLSRITWV